MSRSATFFSLDAGFPPGWRAHSSQNLRILGRPGLHCKHFQPGTLLAYLPSRREPEPAAATSDASVPGPSTIRLWPGALSEEASW